MLAEPMARALGVGTPVVFGAFSVAMLISAFPGPWIGRAIDRFGGRPVLMMTNVLFAAGLLFLASVQGVWSLFMAWALIGLAMGAGLYEAAFATLVRIYREGSRSAITGITLIAGFASTVGWPLSAYLESVLGWRGTCIVWALLHLGLGLPLNALLPRAVSVAPLPPDPHVATKRVSAVSSHQVSRGWMFALLSFVFAATWFISTAMAAHLPGLLQLTGASFTAAVAIGALVGPAQVAGRLLEFGLLRSVHPLWSARLAAFGHPVGIVLLLSLGPQFAPAFAILHGAGNGILTIAKGTLPLALFGATGYGSRQGWLMMPARIAQALAPFAFGLALTRWGVEALWISSSLGVLVLGALMLVRAVGSR